MKSIGLDIGSTTLKAVLVDEDGGLVFSRYLRHNADVPGVIDSVLGEAGAVLADAPVRLAITGSVGMGLARNLVLPFVQEVVAALEFVRQRHSDIATLIDIGGEDAKIIYLKPDGGAELRMNGACAGGTGAFLDQMAILLGVDPGGLNDLALRAKAVHPIASRCGVFSKTDIQNLISANISREDIAASVFRAVAMQTISALSRGCEITPRIFLCGGPLTFLPALRQAFADCLRLPSGDFITPAHANLVTAWGAALMTRRADADSRTFHLADLQRTARNVIPTGVSATMPGIFASAEEHRRWLRAKSHDALPVADPRSTPERVFLGIDSGSTTTKIVATNERDEIIFSCYTTNNGEPLEVVRQGLGALARQYPGLRIAAAAATGYGEELLKAAFGLEFGLIETVAHYLAARHLSPEVSFILDIGGQDMKAIFVADGAIVRMEINEACSSGCGSFIETFARSLGYTAEEFARLACAAAAPADLGTRCTVFMNSSVKQALREGAKVADIAAGLAYSVVRNCLYKVLKLRHSEDLGNEIVVQGGTMRNDAIVAALEQLIGKSVHRPDKPELTGAYGAAIYARTHCVAKKVRETRALAELLELPPPRCSSLRCHGCENRCAVTTYAFAGGASYATGNKCEKVFHNRGASTTPGANLYEVKRRLLFDRNREPDSAAALTIGIARVLNMYEEYPFWQALFSACGIKVVLSDVSSFALYESGARGVMSENLCFPAKLTHGHILNLLDKGVDRIFMPYVVYEKREGPDAANSFNCPIVSGYSDVVKSVIDTRVPIDAPAINFKDRELLQLVCCRYLATLGIKKSVALAALAAAEQAQAEYEREIRRLNREALERAEAAGRMVILLAGRPYHADPLIQHRVAEMIAAMGADVLTDDVVRGEEFDDRGGHLVRQWAYVNRVLRAAAWVARRDGRTQFAELTSFGCGPDAFLQEEVEAVLRQYGKAPTLMKIDDMSSAGALRLRVRSLVESRNYQDEARSARRTRPAVRHFADGDRQRTLLIPFISEYIAPLLPALGQFVGYNVQVLPRSTAETAEIGLRYANNEVCYPATLVVGDIVRALQSGEHDPERTAILLSQTGGQCRASNYIALVRHALAEAGFADVPVLGLGYVEKNRALKINWRRLMPIAFTAMLFADGIAKCHHAAVVREKTPGAAQALTDHYLRLAGSLIVRGERKKLLCLFGEAAQAYDAIVTNAILPKVGVVGEIYLKLNSFANRHATSWLMEHGVEVAPPGLLPFFMQVFVNLRVNTGLGLERSTLTGFLLAQTYHWAARQIARANVYGRRFRYFTPFTDIFEEASGGAEIVSMAAQFGEGWLLPAETVSFARSGVNNVICLQPFGCISNHIVAKGVEKKIKTLYPDLNLLALDYDGGTSHVNITNRLLLFMNNLRRPDVAEAGSV